MSKKAAERDAVMLRARDLFEKSGLTLEQLGERMGYTGDTIRASVWQFLNKTTDPRLSMLRRFAKAVCVPIAELVAEKPTK